MQEMVIKVLGWFFVFRLSIDQGKRVLSSCRGCGTSRRPVSVDIADADGEIHLFGSIIVAVVNENMKIRSETWEVVHLKRPLPRQGHGSGQGSVPGSGATEPNAFTGYQR